MTSTENPLTLSSHAFSGAEERAEFRDEHLDEVARFLHRHLGRYGDPLDDIRACLLRAAGDGPADGGSVTVARIGDEIVGVVVTAATHMSGYVPENLLVYIATHEGHRGRGIGRALIERTIAVTEGAIALHVEPDNPAVGLYRKLGFDSKYLEMRRNG